MTYKNTKTILFAGLIAAMILPFSGMMMAEAAPNDKANDSTIEPKAPTLKEMQANLDKTPREKTPLTAEEKIRNYSAPRSLSGGITIEGTGHIGFGTLLDQDTSSQVGVYSKNEVHDSGITLKDGTVLYAPTILPANNSPVEIVTSYVDPGWWAGTNKNVVLYNHVTGTFDWSNDFVIDSNFIDDYTYTVDGSDYYYTYVYKSGSSWYVYIYDVANTEWDLWDTISGSGSISDGWVAWEEYNFNSDCPTTLPEIKARDVQVYDGGWQDADSSYASEHDDGSICGIDNATFQSEFDEWSVDD